MLGSLDLAEKAALRSGTDAWHFPGVPSLGIAPVRVADCGHGITIMGERSTTATSFPTGVGMASTWNPRLLEAAGAAIGREASGLGVAVVLGPKLNLHRVPLNGRSFETFSEDPWLAGLLGAAVVRGIQSEGVGACIKAIAANSQQADQESISSEVSETALRELYLRQFQLAVEYADPVAVMTSYNRINGNHPSEDAWLLEGIVKGEWGFPGVIVSDWRAVHSPRALTSGLDVEMPGPGDWLDPGSVLAAAERGLVSEAALDDSARRMLRLHQRTSARREDPDQEPMVDSARNRALALRVAEESIVLLRNEASTLPFQRDALRRVLVVGPNAAAARLGGGGSASVTPPYTISPLDGIREALNGIAEVEFLEGTGLTGAMVPPTSALRHLGEDGVLRPGVRVRYRDRSGAVTTEWAVEPTTDLAWGWASPADGIAQSGFTAEIRALLVPQVTGAYRIGLSASHGVAEAELGTCRLGRISEAALATQGFEADYRDHLDQGVVELVAGVRYELSLRYRKTGSAGAFRFEWEPPGRDADSELRAAASRADAVIVCVGLSNQLEGGSRDRESLRLPEIQERLIETVAEANANLAVVLFNGGPLELPWLTKAPAVLEAWYPGQEGGRAVARILFGDVNPSGKLPDTMAEASAYPALAGYPGSDHRSVFAEDLLVGYRFVDAHGIEPTFPFGHGLSYTRFELTPPQVTKATETLGVPDVRVATTIRNVGTTAGAEVVQVYLAYAAENPDRPVRQLRAFEKVHLEPAESADLEFRLGVRELEAWDAELSRWMVRPGAYLVGVGTSSRELAHVRIELAS